MIKVHEDYRIEHLEEMAFGHLLQPDEFYLCAQCQGVHEEEDDARYCCKPKSVMRYKCPNCGEPHLRASRAVSCCGVEVDESKIPEGINYNLKQMYLENAGQIRLLN
jgi:hypothetical protein